MKGHFKNEDRFQILVEGLKKGHTETIQERFDADFIDVREDKLTFEDPVLVEGEAYLAHNDLIVHLDIATEATIPCSICNEPVKIPVVLKGIYFREPLDEIKTGVYSLAEPIREAILIQSPTFAECNEGHCRERKEIEKYLKKTSSRDGEYHPFENL